MLNSKGGAPANGYKQKGLVNLNERIRQQFGPAYGVSIEQRDGGGIRVKITAVSYTHLFLPKLRDIHGG